MDRDLDGHHAVICTATWQQRCEISHEQLPQCHFLTLLDITHAFRIVKGEEEKEKENEEDEEDEEDLVI